MKVLVLPKFLNYNLIKNSFWMIAEKALRLLFGVYISAIVARHLSPDGFGQLNYAIALLTVASTLSALGLKRIIVLKIVESIGDIEIQGSIINTTIALRFVASILIFLFISIASIYLELDNRLMYIAIFLSLLFTPLDVFELYQQALSDVKLISVARFSSMVLSNLLKLVLVLTDQPLQYFFVAVLFEYLITAVLLTLVFIYKHKWSAFNSKAFSITKAKECLTESWPEIIAGFGAVLFLRLDQIMLKGLTDSASVGIYSAAIRLSEAWYFVPSAIVAATFPFIIRGKNHSKECYRQRFRVLLSVLLVVAISFALLMTVASQWVVDFIYGSVFSESASVLLIHCWAGVFVCMGMGSGSILAAENRLKWNLYRNLLGLTVNIALNFILINKYGVIGAALATLISVFVAFWLSDLFFKPIRYMFFEKLKAFNFLQLFDFTYLRRLASGF